MKNNVTKILSLILSVVLVIGAFAVYAFAASGNESVNVEIDQVYEGRGGIITLTFDDGRTDTTQLVNELLKKYELNGTLMLIGARTQNNLSVLKDAIADGVLVPQNHSMNHIGMREDLENELQNLNDSAYKTEIVDSKAYFEQLFPEYDMLTFAVPNGRWYIDAAEVAMQNYYMVRYSYGGLQSLDPGYEMNKTGNWSAIKCISINTQSKPGQIADLKAQVDQAAEGMWMCTLVHRVGEMSDYEMNTEEAEELFSYISACEKNGLVWVTDTATATKYIRERQNTTVSAKKVGNAISISSTLASKTQDGLALDPEIFNQPLTVKVEVGSDFEKAYYLAGDVQKEAEVFTEGEKRYARVEIIPGGEDVVVYSDPDDINFATVELSAKIADAEDTLKKAVNKLDKNDYSELEALVEAAYELKQSYTDKDEIKEMITSLDEETRKINALLKIVDIWNKGAKETIFDTAKDVKVIHLNSNGTYTMSSPGTSKTFTLYQTVDGVTTEVATWTDGSAYARLSEKNPCVAFILDGDVTFTGTSSWYGTNVMFDLNGYNIKFTSASSAPINLKNGASVEFRGEGTIIWATTGYYMVQGDNYNGVLTLNGDVTLDTQDTNAKVAFYIKGGIYVYGTFTVKDNFNATDKGAVFFTQGSRSNAKDIKGFLEIVDATVNANNYNGAALFYAKGVSGTYNGVTYTSVPEFNITNSTLNLTCPLVSNLWGSDSVTGNYADTTEHELENPVNATMLNVVNSTVNANLYYDTTMTESTKVTLIAPKGKVTINVLDSSINMTHGRFIGARGDADLTVTVNNSLIYTKTSEADIATLKQTWSSATILRGTTFVMSASAKGIATFTDCTIISDYRVFEGSNKDVSNEKFFITSTETNIKLTSANCVLAVRSNVIFNSGELDCGKGNLTYVVLPYNPTTNTGVLIKCGVRVINHSSSSYDKTTDNKYVKTVSEYAALAAADPTVYGTYGASNLVTIEDGTVFYKIPSATTVSGRYSYRLIHTDLAELMTFVPLTNIELYTDFVYNVYVPTLGSITKIELNGAEFDPRDLKTVTEGADTYYVVSTGVMLGKAADTFKLKITVTTAGEPAVGTWTLSVVNYLEDLLASGQSDTVQSLAKDILSYIRAAYEYKDIDASAVARINGIIGIDYDATSKPDTNIAEQTDLDGLESASIALGDAPAYVFCVKAGLNAADFRFSAAGRTLKSVVFTDKEGKEYIVVSMYAFLMAESIEYTVVGTDIDGAYSIKNYYEFAKTQNDNELTTLVERLWKYAESAKAYKAEVDA